MAKAYEPELGQMVFGQPWQALDIEGKSRRALDALSALWDALLAREANPFGNTAGDADLPHCRICAYSWNDDDDLEFNFAWRDWRVCWYKYLGRGMSCNRALTDAERAEMLAECLADIQAVKA